MKHAEHVYLLQDGIIKPGGIWADFGSGAGAFTLALADLLDSGSEIYSIDRSISALKDQQLAMGQRFPAVVTHYLNRDFNTPINLPPLDGIVMANALHFQHDKEKTLQRVKAHLKPGGCFILVEYNSDKGNQWVPYPLSIQSWIPLAGHCGFVDTRLLARVPSSFMGEFYSALSRTPAL